MSHRTTTDELSNSGRQNEQFWAPLSGTAPSAIALLPGTCFQIVSPEGGGRPIPCAEPVTARGGLRDGVGRRWRVYACGGHAHELTDARAVVVRPMP